MIEHATSFLDMCIFIEGADPSSSEDSFSDSSHSAKETTRTTLAGVQSFFLLQRKQRRPPRLMCYNRRALVHKLYCPALAFNAEHLEVVKLVSTVSCVRHSLQICEMRNYPLSERRGLPAKLKNLVLAYPKLFSSVELCWRVMKLLELKDSDHDLA